MKCFQSKRKNKNLLILSPRNPSVCKLTCGVGVGSCFIQEGEDKGEGKDRFIGT